MSLVPTSEVWQHGLLPLPGESVSEASLLALLGSRLHVTAADGTIGMEQWVALAESGLGMRREQSAACMRLCHILAPPVGASAMPKDEALRVPLGSLLLLLWVQWAHLSLGQGLAPSKAQTATGDVWPSLLQPPSAAASANVVDGGARPNALSLALHVRFRPQWCVTGWPCSRARCPRCSSSCARVPSGFTRPSSTSSRSFYDQTRRRPRVSRRAEVAARASPPCWGCGPRRPRCARRHEFER